jgi:ABC-type lipoprotein release transport system permease subunit
VSPRDPLVLALVAAALVGTGLVASLLPGMRATRADPMDALRAE